MSKVKYPKYETQSELVRMEQHMDHQRRMAPKVPVYRIRRVEVQDEETKA